MKNWKRALSIITMVAVSAVAFAGTANSVATDIELVDGYEISYEVAPTDSVLEYLEGMGVDTAIISNDAAFDTEMANFFRLESVDEDEDGEISADESYKQQLVDKVNAALFGEYDGDNVVYMELGNYRWVLSPWVDLDDE